MPALGSRPASRAHVANSAPVPMTTATIRLGSALQALNYNMGRLAAGSLVPAVVQPETHCPESVSSDKTSHQGPSPPTAAPAVGDGHGRHPLQAEFRELCKAVHTVEVGMTDVSSRLITVSDTNAKLDKLHPDMKELGGKVLAEQVKMARIMQDRFSDLELVLKKQDKQVATMRSNLQALDARTESLARLPPDLQLLQQTVQDLWRSLTSSIGDCKGAVTGLSGTWADDMIKIKADIEGVGQAQFNGLDALRSLHNKCELHQGEQQVLAALQRQDVRLDTILENLRGQGENMGSSVQEIASAQEHRLGDILDNINQSRTFRRAQEEKITSLQDTLRRQGQKLDRLSRALQNMSDRHITSRQRAHNEKRLDALFEAVRILGDKMTQALESRVKGERTGSAKSSSAKSSNIPTASTESAGRVVVAPTSRKNSIGTRCQVKEETPPRIVTSMPTSEDDLAALFASAGDYPGESSTSARLPPNRRTRGRLQNHAAATPDLMNLMRVTAPSKSPAKTIHKRTRSELPHKSKQVRQSGRSRPETKRQRSRGEL